MTEELERQSYRLQARRDFSVAGFALFAMFLTGQLLQNLLGFPLSRIWPAYAEDAPILYWVVLFAPIYLIALPVCLAILRRIPEDRAAAARPAVGRPLSFLQWFRLLPVALFLMYCGNMIGMLFTLVISQLLPGGGILSGQDVNPLLELLSVPGFWPRVAVVCLIGPFAEELVFRKNLIDRTRIYGEELSVLFSSVMFGLFHGNLQQGVYAALLGLLLGYVYLRTRDIRFSFGIHACVNFIGGVIAPAALLGGREGDLTDLSAITEISSSLIAFGFGVIFLFLLGGILFVALWRRVFFLPAERELQGGERRVSWKNPGVILFALTCIASIIAMLVLGVTF